MSLIRAVGLAPLLFATGVALSPAMAFTSGGWQGKANNDEAGKFSDCTMTADYKNGVMLAFIISRDFDWGLVLVKDDWSFQPGNSEPVTLAIDADAPIESTAKVVDPKGILVPLENADPTVNALRNGKQLTVATPSAPTVSSSATPMRRSRHLPLASPIVFKMRRHLAASPSPRATPSLPPGARRNNRLFTEQEAVAFATTLLTAAGIADYELVEPAKNPMPNFDVVWTYPNGMIGALAAFKDMGAIDVDQAANVVMADDAKNCQGEFSSGKKIAEDRGEIRIRRVFTVCRTGGNTVEIHYTLFKTESGHLYQLAHLNLGDATGDIANADSGFLKPEVVATIK